ncbi:hypothetical protein [Streptomyces hydrogenans]|uniref:hypothetical protein n=1 Tax=Streptomyces hydrogenans TaxID=1873719 RepID=UPI0035DFC887
MIAPQKRRGSEPHPDTVRALVEAKRKLAGRALADIPDAELTWWLNDYLIPDGKGGERKLMRAELADLLGVTRQALHVRSKRSGLEVEQRRPDYSAYIPWQVEVAHTNAWWMQLLRLMAQADEAAAGRAQAKRVVNTVHAEAFRKKLHDSGCVVAYDPKRADPFYLVKRRPGVDTWWVAVPEAAMSEEQRHEWEKQRQE